MEYYSSTFNTLHKIGDDKSIFEINCGLLYKFLDYLFLIVDLDLKKYNFFLKAPQNILITSNGESFRFFIGNEKAISELNIISARISKDTDLMTLDKASVISTREFGFSFKYYFDIQYSQLTNAMIFIRKKGDATVSDRLNSYQALLDDVVKYVAAKQSNQPLNLEFTDMEFQASEASFMNCCLNAQQQLSNQIKKEHFIMDINPKFKARDIVINPKQCFYVMDFNDENVEESYNALSKALMDKLGIRVVKSGDIFDPNRTNEMVENIWQDIMNSRLVIADISCKNPNVFYELGICDTVGKNVLTICNSDSFKKDYSKKLPFDVQQELTTIYENSYSGVSKMVDKIVQMVKAIINDEPIIVGRD